MELQLSPDIEEKLVAESEALGISPAELSAQVLARHVLESGAARDQENPRSSRTISELIAEMKRRTPNWATNDPYAVDWQSLKAEGRRY